LDIYGGNFLTVYSGAATLSAASSGLHTATGAIPPPSVSPNLVFSPSVTSSLQVNPGAGLWLKPTATSFSLDLPLGNTGASVLMSTSGSIRETAASSIAASGGRLLLIGLGGNDRPNHHDTTSKATIA